MQQSLSTSALHFLGNLPVFEAERAPSRTAANGLFLDSLRANLQAAARHAALGHAGPSFRECRGAACMEAARLIPELAPELDPATGAGLDAILDQVLITLEKEGTPLLAPQPS